MRTSRRTIRIFAIAVGIAAMPLSTSHALEPNLIANPSFESSPLPPDGRPFNQPVLPTDWTFEGVTALFDHTPHNAHNGQYAAAISGSYSGPRKDCSVSPCVDVPGGAERDTAYGVYSLAPSWRAKTFPVVAGATYRFSVWVRLSIPKDATGARTYVRWLDANGVPVGRTNGPSLIAGTGGASYATFVAGATSPGAYRDYSTDWTYRVATIVPPSGAVSGVVLLSYTDDAWIGQVVYDHVCFARKIGITPTLCDTTYAP